MSQIKELAKRIPPWVFQWVRRVVLLSVLSLIVYQISRIGWMEVLRELPTHPGYYLLFVLIYLSLPLAEVVMYRMIWGKAPSAELFRLFLVKRVYNEEVAGYSGEVYLYAKVRKLTGLSDGEIARNIRDFSIISSVVSHLVAVVLVVGLILADLLPFNLIAGSVDLDVAVGIGIAVVALVGAAVFFRKHLFNLPVVIAAKVFGVYLLRFVVNHLLLMLQWAIVMPEVGWNVWIVMIALFIIVNRIPILPGKDMIFVWAGIGLSGVLDVASAGVAAMLVVYGALMRLTNLGVYLGLDLRKSKSD